MKEQKIAKSSTRKARFKGKKVLLPFLIFVGIFASFFVISYAQDLLSAQSLEISPASQELSVDPGQSLSIKATLRNKSDQTLPVSARIEDFTAEGSEGQVALTTGGTYSVTSWSSVAPARFNLGPGDSQQVTVTVRVPQGAAGGRYGSVVFAVGSGETEGAAANVSQEIASLFLLRISGPVTEDLTLTSFSAPKFSEFGPVPLFMKFKNEGNVHVKTVGLVNVTGMFNKKVADVVIPPTNVFPGSEREVTAFLDKKILIGPYTGTAIVYFGSKNESINATVSFFVFPVRFVAAAVAVLFIVYLLRKRLGKALKALFG